MDCLPVFLDIKDQHCIIVGGGKIAARKGKYLIKAKAKVTFIAPTLEDDLVAALEDNTLLHIAREYQQGDLDNAYLVIAATDNTTINQQIANDAKLANILVNVADKAEVGNFIIPSVIDRSPIQIALSTGGTSPVLSRLLKSRLESFIPASYGRLAQILGEYRDQVKARFAAKDRRLFWEKVIDGNVSERILSGNEKVAREILEQDINTGTISSQRGEVYLVGAGPGDPDLLTFRALRLIQQADVVVYDRLVSQGILDMVRKDAEFIYAGKERDNHAIAQENINELLCRLAKENKRVLRLKGGDPFIFGRGGEEIMSLMAEHIDFQVVPGITAAAGCAAYSGIPLTHRDYAQSCVFVTGHLKDGSVDLNWKALAQPHQTVVFYMGLHSVHAICQELIAQGVSEDKPVALIEQGTTQNQRTHTATLKTLEATVAEKDIQPPTLIIVGEVVELHKQLSWFEPQGEHTRYFQSAGKAIT